MNDIFHAGHCWNSIGVWSNSASRCEKLKDVTHCRNCEVYRRAGREIFEREITQHYLEYWAKFYADSGKTQTDATQSVIVFRLADLWLALPTAVFSEISRYRGLHRIPHHKNELILGLVNVRGRISLCFSLADLLGVEVPRSEVVPKSGVLHVRRQLVVSINDELYVFHVDEIGGVSRYAISALADVPASFEHLDRPIIAGMVDFPDKQVFLLDPQLLSRSIREAVGE